MFCEEHFNEDGKLLTLIEYDEVGKIVLNEERQYTKGMLSKVYTNNMIFDAKQLSQYVHINGLLVEEIEYYTKNWYIATRITYDAYSRIVLSQKEDEH